LKSPYPRFRISFCITLIQAMSFIGIGLLPFSAFAKEVAVSGVDSSVLASTSDYNRIAIIALKGSVKINQGGLSSSPILKISKSLNEKTASSEATQHFEKLGVSVHREAQTLVVEYLGPSSKSDDVDWLKASQPDLKIDLSGFRAVPVDIFLREGMVEIVGTTQSVSATVVDGVIRAIDSSGTLKLSAQKGEIRVEGSRGRVSIDATSAKVTALRNDGELTIGNLSGESNVSDHKGAIELKTYSGVSNISKSSGTLDIALGRGALNLNGFEGPVRGQTDQAAITATLIGESEVNLTSEQGPVTLKLPSGSGASIHLQSEEGSVQAPPPLKPLNGNTHQWTGRMAGELGRGSVVVHSKSGSIRIR
jgi:hypothetical protein